MSLERFQELAILLPGLREAYYNLSPKIPDQEYDAIRDEFKSLAEIHDPNHPEIKAVGAPVPQNSAWEKAAHEIPMGSLDKVNSLDEFKKWIEGITPNTIHITHKIDGSSMELVYKAGKLVRAVTRGDGKIGEDVTYNVAQIPDVPKTILIEDINITVRGEVVMFKQTFQDKYAEQYANPRNTAAGKVRDRKGGGADCANLNFLAYWMAYEGADKPSTMFYTFKFLKSLGFNVPECAASIELQGIINEYENAVKRRDEIPYEIDGMVVSVNNMKELEELGDLNMRPRGQIAWKFDPATGITKVMDIKWQVGPTGRITPVASVEPVNVGGVTITSISLHNIALFTDLKLFQGCRVLISRRNDVIPYIEKNLDMEEAA